MKRRIIWAWCMYDWANSAYPLVISTALFPVYFGIIARTSNGSNTVELAGTIWHTASLYSLAIAISYAINAALLPVLSGIADWSGRKKQFMSAFCTLGAVGCVGLALMERQTIWIGIVSAIIANVGFNGSLVFYNAFLPEIAPPRLHDRISAMGYIFGYIGSSLLLIAIVVVLLLVTTFGIEKNSQEAFLRVAPWAFIAVAVWWRGFAVVTLRLVPERNATDHQRINESIVNGWRALSQALVHVTRNPVLLCFLGAYLAASMGVQSVILLASVFGEQELHMDTSLLVAIVLLVQFVAALGSWLCAKLTERWGNTRTLVMIAAVWGLVCIAAYAIVSAIHFALLSAAVGLVLGGMQSQMRSTFSKLITSEPVHASLFSLYDIAEKIGTTAGMGTFSIVVSVTGSLRSGALALSGGFAITIILLLLVHHSARHHAVYRRITQPQHAR
ncbi:MAG: MFS transporter [Chlorobi bacterium]|nr:MFS transporter [Chlorobiota bacterium]